MYFDLEAKTKDKGGTGNRICSAEHRIFPSHCLSVSVRPVAYRIHPTAQRYTPSTSIRPVAYRVRPVACR